MHDLFAPFLLSQALWTHNNTTRKTTQSLTHHHNFYLLFLLATNDTMDDLLALMDGSDALPDEDVDATTNLSPSSSPQHLPATAATAATNAASIPNNPFLVTPSSESNSNSNNQKKKKKSMAQCVEAKVDSQLGIRMIDRKIGSLDLLELIQTRNYHSPAALAAMSLAALNQQLADPALVVGPSTVNGNTNLYTIGIVFSNSGTKIAAKGNAFCILQIGSNIQSGPTVSVLLFGPAYSKYCKAIQPGCVIALDNPRLIPPKQDNGKGNSKFQDTAISFTINDENRHLAVVARARDFGICQAAVKGKNAEGQWVKNARRCTTAIDTRAGKYCFLHRNQQNVQAATTKPTATAKPNNNVKNGSFMQQQRQQLNVQPLKTPGRPLLLPNNKNALTGASGSNPFLQAAKAIRLPGVPRQMSKVQGGVPQQSQPMNSAGGLRRNTQPNVPQNRPTNNSLLNPSNNNMQAKATNRLLHPSRSQKIGGHPNSAAAAAAAATVMNKAKITVNPYASKQKTPAIGNSMLANSTNRQQQQKQRPKCASTQTKQTQKAVLDWLPSSRKKSANSVTATGATKLSSNSKPKKGPKLNTSAMGGFNGSVVVPKPSKILFAAGDANNSALFQPTVNSIVEEEDRVSPEEILFKQQQLAQQRQLLSQDSSKQPAKISFSKKKAATAKPKETSGFFGSSLLQTNEVVTNIDHERVLNAKSRFATEADAEAYAASRRRVTELEQEEAKKEAMAKKENGQSKDGDGQTKKVVLKEWTCRTCNNRRSKTEPKGCIRARHAVSCKRILNKETETKEDKRLKMSRTSARDGGLVLGAGIEWDRANFSRFS